MTLKCPACRFENTDDSKFCVECGEKIELRCPGCGKTLPLEAKFCNGCGRRLSETDNISPPDLSLHDKLRRIQCYLPERLAERILSQKDKIEGERRQVTVVFCDMKGFTQITHQLGPEQTFSLMDQVLEILIHKVHEYGGTVNEIRGDGILALFGAPIAVEDAPQRAIRSSLAIHREMIQFSQKVGAELELPPILLRIGINAGPVVVGAIGNDLRIKFTAMGDTINLASRMETLAAPGTTYVTEETFKLTEGFFRFEAVAEERLIGTDTPVTVFRVIAPSGRRTRFDVSAERGLTPLVGRERELELLTDSFERAKAGNGQAVSIVSEAGMGKSRLLYEFRKSVTHEDVLFLEGKCLSYSKGVAYHPVIDILKSTFRIQEGEEDSVVRQQILEGLEFLDIEESGILPYLLEVLSVKDSGLDRFTISLQSLKERLNEALLQILIKGSEIRPLIVAIEDLHWADTSSIDLFNDLLGYVPGARVLLIFTYRPQFVPSWSLKSYHCQISLNCLLRRESLSMVVHLLNTRTLDRKVETMILEKTEGVPFFVEEFVTSLLDLNIITKIDDTYRLAKNLGELSIPSTISDVIMARVDSLKEPAKELLQIGSIIEREFSHRLIELVAGFSKDELKAILAVLKNSELLIERGVYPQSTYVFRHALTREVIYDSILKDRRKTLHAEIGAVIEELYADSIDEYAGILAEHYLAGEDYEKAGTFCKLAAKRLEKTSSFLDAIAYTEKSIYCLERLPQTEEQEISIIDARTALGLYNINMSYHVEAEQAVSPILELAIKRNYLRRVSQIYTIIGSHCYVIEEDYPRAFRYLEEALEAARDLNDILSLWMANYWLGLTLVFKCEFDRALDHWGQELKINEAANSLWGISSLNSMIGGWIYNWQGKLELGKQTTGMALKIAEESGDIYSKTYAYASHGYSCFCRGFLKESEGLLLRAAEFSEKIDYFTVGAMIQRHIGDTYLDLGNFTAAQNAYERAIAHSERVKFVPSLINFYKLSLERARVKDDKRAMDLESLYRYYEDNQVLFNAGLMPMYIADILMDIDDHHLDKAEGWIQKAIDADRQNGLILHLGKHFALYAELLNRKGDSQGAKDHLGKAIDVFKECGAQGRVERLSRQLHDLL